MKTIILMTVKNEEWIIDTTLSILSQISDEIIIADNNSSDETINIIEKYKVNIIENNSTTPSNIIRWDLLDSARQNFGKSNLILCIDADEFVTPKLFWKYKKNILNNPGGTIFSSQWVQVWRDVNKYRSDDSVWNPKTNIKPYMFLDNGIVDYVREPLLIDHTSRVPELNINNKKILKFPLIHLQFANWKRAQIKQLWYQCIEVSNGADVEEVNNKYKSSSNEKNISYKNLKSSWKKGIYIPESIQSTEISNSWYINQIKEMVDSFGKKIFENLEIWNSQTISKIHKDILK